MNEFASREYPVKEHMRFQRRMWVVERVGWTVLVLIAALGLAGLFGSGFLSRGKVEGNGLSVTYERFERATRLSEFSFRFGPGQGERTLYLNSAFQKSYEITRIQPEPVRSEADGDGLSLTFAIPSSGGTVILRAHAHSYGISRLETRADDASPLTFSVMIYP